MNAFAKPNDQIDACISFGMAKKGRMKSNAFAFSGCKGNNNLRFSDFRFSICSVVYVFLTFLAFLIPQFSFVLRYFPVRLA